MNQIQWLFLFLVSPIVIAFLVRCLSLVLDIVDVNHVEPKIIEVIVEKEKIVYKDRPKKKTKKTKKTNETNPIIEETISALKSLGVAKKKGREIASSLFSEKRHTNAEDLLKDCLAKM